MSENKFNIKLADKVIELDCIYPYIKEFCKDYLTDKRPEIFIRILPADIEFEREKAAKEDVYEGIPKREFPADYLETVAAYRKIATKMLEYDVLLVHGSCIAVDGIAYLFTAKSGVGKSTHTHLWERCFGDRFTYINDDKPLLAVSENGVIAYGTPWDGKHRKSNNVSFPLKNVCFIYRKNENHIEKANSRDVFLSLLQQVYRPDDVALMQKVFSLMDKCISKLNFYSLGCNMDLQAALVAYNKMNERN